MWWRRKTRKEEYSKVGEERGGVDTHGIHSLLRSFQTRRMLGAISMAARLPARRPELLARLASWLTAWLAASALDYLKNRIPSARNCVSRLVFMYQHTVVKQCWLFRCLCACAAVTARLPVTNSVLSSIAPDSCVTR